MRSSVKAAAVFLAVLLILCSFAGCKKNDNPEETPSENTEESASVSETENGNFSDSSDSSESETVSEKETETKKDTSSVKVPSSAAGSGGSQSSTTGTSGGTGLEELETSEVVTYYCDDVNNKYIKTVANEFSVEASSLIALIRTNAVNAGATVLQFSGKTDSSGNLLTTEDELKAVYEVSDSDGSVKKATGGFTGNVGYNYIESLAVFKLTKEFILPQLDEMKRERPYKG